MSGHFQGRGKVFYVGGAVGEGGGGGGESISAYNITPNRNRKSCYSLRTFMRSCWTTISYFTNGNRLQ